MGTDAFYLGADPKNRRRLCWIETQERWAHMAVFGASGSGKSNLLLDVFMQDVMSERGCCLIDPKGDLIQDVLAAIAAAPEEAWPRLAEDLILIDPSDAACPVAFNPLEVTSYGTPSRQRQEMVGVFRKIWKLDEAQTPRLGLVLRRSLQLAMENNLTICDLQRILTDNEYRLPLVERSADESLRIFWQREFPSSGSAQLQWSASTLTRLESLLDDPSVRRMLGQRRSSFDFRRAMDQGKVVLINLAKGRLGQETSGLLGGLLLTKLQMAAESRQEIWPPESRRVFYLFVDEFQNYATRSFEEMLAEARGYGLSLVMANQHLAQLDEALRKAVLSNARIRVAFRVSSDDASVLAQEFWRFQGDRVKETRWDTVNIGKLHIPIPEHVYHSAGDEGRQNREALHYLANRMFWLHVQGQGAATFLRSVDIPRDRLAGSRDRVQRFKRLLAGPQSGGELAVAVEPYSPVGPAKPGYRWVGRSEKLKTPVQR